jgi:uncharacterized MAPEG superfamily protein
MPIELTLLGATLILAVVQIMLTARLRTRQYGVKWNTSARDEVMPPLDPAPARMLRAQQNLFETLPLFIGAVLGAAAAHRFGLLTSIGAHLYFFGRLIYVPLYALGIPVVRTIVWSVATLGLVLVIVGFLFG